MKAARLLLLIPLLVACGTVSHGGRQVISVTSNPSGAIARSEGCGNDVAFRTPGEFRASRRAVDCRVLISAEGFEPALIPLTRLYASDAHFGVAEQYLGVALVEGPVIASAALVSALVDWATGGIYELYPTAVSAQLRPNASERDVPGEAPDDGTTAHLP